MEKILTFIRSRKRMMMILLACAIVLVSTSIAVVAALAAQDTDSSNQEQKAHVEAIVETEPTTAPTEAETEPVIVLNETPVLYADVVYVRPINDAAVEESVHELDLCIRRLYDECENGHYTEDAITSMQNEILRLEGIQTTLNADLAKFARWREEHYYAAETWFYLRENGISEEVAAGIIGNMMAETSGGTLNLKPEIYSSGNGFYGLCQWSLYYRPHVAGMSFEDQLPYLIETMPKEFGNYAFLYKKGFSYDAFLALDNPEDVALAFAKVYERCGSGSYNARQRYAMKAYEYFTGE